MSASKPDTHQKALEINLDPKKYGTVVEIGAGQEVARWFFRVGAAAGTVAKTMSAYDMQVSDAIYGKSGRYVSGDRLNAMLDHEWGLLLERLTAERGDERRPPQRARDTPASRGQVRGVGSSARSGRPRERLRGPAPDGAAQRHPAPSR